MSEPTLLLVEDDPNDVLLLRRAFRKANVTSRLQVVANGELAISYLLGENDFANRENFPLPALMLLDLKLPRRTGLEVLAWLRQQPLPLKRLPAVILTSSRQAVDINRAYELGVNSYLVKPAEFEQLLEMISTFHHYWLTHNEKPEVQAQP